MTAPDPKWVEAGAKASAQWHRNEDAWDSDDRALAYLILTAALPLIREQIATDIEAVADQPLDDPDNPVLRLIVEGMHSAARIARGGAQ